MSSQATIMDGGNLTIREGQDSISTIREKSSAVNVGNLGENSSFRGYKIIRQMPSTSTEADIFVVSKNDTKYVLKLYRYGIDPKNDILQSIKNLSEAYPENFIRVFETDFDTDSKRWYEVQEYAKYGTLSTLIDNNSKLSSEQKNKFFSSITQQIGESLNLLHKNNLLHLDIKPSNILLRSIEPLDMVLIDFGIATSLASDMSKKFTQTRGTPMYQSPESWSGGVGRSSDWWGLGMILLEVANGYHPFRGLSSNVIERALATDPAPINEDIDAGQKELLYGLLTRNPDKRWNWEQVSKWLKGERGIPNYFEKSVIDSADTKRPYTFMKKKYYSLDELANVFVQDEASWIQGREHLMRGYIRQWLESNQEFDVSIELEKVISETNDNDVRLFKFTQKYGIDIPFIFGGHAITFNNLLLFAGKAQPTSMEKKIIDLVHNGRILYCLEQINSSKYDNFIQSLLRKLVNKSSGDILTLLNFFAHPQKYYCPFVGTASTPEEVMKASEKLEGLPMTKEDFDQKNSEFIIPSALIDKMKSALTYNEAYSTLESIILNRSIMLRKDYDRLNEKYILPDIMVKKLNSASDYTEARNELQRLERENLLLLRSTASIRKTSFDTLNDYLNEVYKVQWGYDEDIVKKVEASLSNFRKREKSAQNFELAQLQLWIAYLEFIHNKNVPLVEADKKILRNISLRRTDELEKRISVLVNGN